MNEHPREFRPYRVTLYVLAGVFTFLFIFLVARSVWIDLYGRAPIRPAATEHPTVSECARELLVLYRTLTRRSELATALTPEAERTWEEFSRRFEDQLEELRSRCSDAQGDTETRAAILDVVDKLDTLRQHLSRCGEEGERERAVVAQAIERLRQARSSLGP